MIVICRSDYVSDADFRSAVAMALRTGKEVRIA